MIDPVASPSMQTSPPSVDEVIRLKCPECGGGLHLKRKFIGLKGQCVHCQGSLTAIEENGTVRIVMDAPGNVIGEGEVSSASPGPQPQAHAAIPGSSMPAFLTPMPTRLDDNLFPPLSAPPVEPSAEAKVLASPFGDSGSFALPFASSFGDEKETASILPAWGTNVPREKHASISPFGQKAAPGGGFADSLFRPKPEAAQAGVESGIPTRFTSTFTPESKEDSLSPKPETPVTENPKQDCRERVILDGDGRPMRPMTKEEEEDFAKNFFKYENARTKPRWFNRILRKLKRILIGFCLLAGVAAVAACFVPKEKLLVWKKNAIEWLEPGMAVLDYLPEPLRPKWLPQSKFGIDAGVDEKGQPKKKLNAFEGLDKLKGDVGNMRGAADAQLKELNNF